jgi:6-phosphogluconolactonase (cycloisomerase 2 family)
MLMKWNSLFVCSILSFLLFVASPTLRAQNSGFVYVENNPTSADQPGSILGFSITDNTGALTPVPGSPFQIPSGGFTLAVTPSGRFLYAYTNIPGVYGAWGVAGYAIDANSGSLTPISGSPFFVSTNFVALTTLRMDPSGKFLYIMGYYTGEIDVLSIDQNTGALTPQPNSPFFAQFSYPVYFNLDAAGQFAYVAYQPNRSGAPNGAVSAYKTDPASGSFTLVPGSPFIVPRDPSANSLFFGATPNWAVSDPNSKFLYVTDDHQFDLWTFSIDPTSGALTLLPSSPMHFPEGANQFTIDPGGNFAYFTTNFPNPVDCGNYYPFTNVHAPNAVFVYSIDRNSGDLSPAKTPVVTAGYRTLPVATDASGTYVYALNLLGYNNDPNSSTISAYRSRGIGGPLTEVLGSPFPAGAHAAATLVVAAPQKKN